MTRASKTLRSKSVAQRFWEKVAKVESGCWEWQDGKDENGYGRFAGLERCAHRMAWVLINGSIPSGLYICHKCDNPSCVNPDHLFVGTPRDNTQDMLKKGRDGIRGTRHGKAKLTPEQVAEIFDALYGDAEYVDTYQLGKKYGVSVSTIMSIATGRRYHHGV